MFPGMCREVKTGLERGRRISQRKPPGRLSPQGTASGGFRPLDPVTLRARLRPRSCNTPVAPYHANTPAWTDTGERARLYVAGLRAKRSWHTFESGSRREVSLYLAFVPVHAPGGAFLRADDGIRTHEILHGNEPKGLRLLAALQKAGVGGFREPLPALAADFRRWATGCLHRCH